ncbi:hypothetical protein N7499_005950 [Penicillium canescens]|uniref:Uncharacterized protein n=1 Tax=Penicillium canescens TaxID=5083 RepID=A0AAD6N949_PENCN|nr:uncharacterized protein N7446_001722 [Penicillium canescens]KAJ6043524.1 hypothetical protein N7460_004879 [Penicillium canescens]KAJ6054998.1 hypothetical protein N7444_004096 [Penicillium canescens]KAJ6073945.1 hypothetical protein N7446_001722 [Penicillium canescens]KAJ6081076.1 hypothetical protein N7499_005950 [Penicillium canescens]KAJ6177128.1 hypothetical protein N7485_004042 [Penicillium canescens]
MALGRLSTVADNKLGTTMTEYTWADRPELRNAMESLFIGDLGLDNENGHSRLSDDPTGCWLRYLHR